MVIRLGHLPGRLQQHLVVGAVLGPFVEGTEQAILPQILQRALVAVGNVNAPLCIDIDDITHLFTATQQLL